MVGVVRSMVNLSRMVDLVLVIILEILVGVGRGGMGRSCGIECV